MNRRNFIRGLLGTTALALVPPFPSTTIEFGHPDTGLPYKTMEIWIEYDEDTKQVTGIDMSEVREHFAI